MENEIELLQKALALATGEAAFLKIAVIELIRHHPNRNALQAEIQAGSEKLVSSVLNQTWPDEAHEGLLQVREMIFRHVARP